MILKSEKDKAVEGKGDSLVLSWKKIRTDFSSISSIRKKQVCILSSLLKSYVISAGRSFLQLSVKIHSSRLNHFFVGEIKIWKQ